MSIVKRSFSLIMSSNIKVRVGINGFGRRGRTLCRILLKEDSFEVVAINDPYISLEHMRYLLSFDSIHGSYPGVTATEEGCLLIHNHPVRTHHCKTPIEIPWSQDCIDIVFECTGEFNSESFCQGHIKAGAKKVIITAPPTDETPIICCGMNDSVIPQTPIVSIASPTTMCLAPLIHHIDRSYGVSHVFFTVSHAITSAQHVSDGVYIEDGDVRLGRATNNNIIPTGTGASFCLSRLFPQLSGTICANSVRVPVSNVCFVEVILQLFVPVEINTVKQFIIEKSKGDMAGIIGYTEESVVSGDFQHCRCSCVVDGQLLKVIDGKYLCVCCWYDNEWGYCNRAADIAKLIM